MLLIIDNYDSFVYNIFHWIDYPEEKIIIRRNDQFRLEDIVRWGISHIIISPGPMSPLQAGLSNSVIKCYGDKIPILGICLGFQCIGHCYGCEVNRHDKPTHGKSSEIFLASSPIFKGLESSISAGRYHSLYISQKNFNDVDLKITAEMSDHTVMAIEHRLHPIYGVLFHPESILTGECTGTKILNNFIAL